VSAQKPKGGKGKGGEEGKAGLHGTYERGGRVCSTGAALRQEGGTDAGDVGRGHDTTPDEMKTRLNRYDGETDDERDKQK
jgi:hypothetical protein